MKLSMIERWEIPASWRWKDLADIGEVAGGGTPSTKDASNFADESGVPWVTPADLSGYSEIYISSGRRALSSRGLRNSGATLLPRGSILFSSRAPIGYCAIAAAAITTNQGFKNLILNPAMSSEYVREYLAGSTTYAESKASGTTFKELSAAKFSRLRIPVAPPAEQREIAAKLRTLRALTTSVRGCIAGSQNELSQLRADVLRRAFTGGLTQTWRQERSLESSSDLVARSPKIEQPPGGRKKTDKVVKGGVALRLNSLDGKLPKGWSWQPLVRLARQESGHTPSRANAAYWNGDIQWVGIKDAAAHHGRSISATTQTISELGLANSSARLLPTHTVLLCRTAASIGYVCKLDQPMATSQDFVAFTCGPALNPRYLVYLLLGERAFLKSLGRGTAHPTIYLPEIRAFTIAVAPYEEQLEIVERLDALISQLDIAENELNAAESLIPHLSHETHYQAFTGKLIPAQLPDVDLEIALQEGKIHLAQEIFDTQRIRNEIALAEEQPTVSQQLARKYEVWPESGYTFEELKDSLTGTYDEIRAGVFAALRKKNIVQKFDQRRRVMTFIRVPQ